MKIYRRSLGAMILAAALAAPTWLPAQQSGRFQADIDKMLDAVLDPFAQRRKAFGSSEGDRRYLESRGVVLFEQADRHKRNWMVVKVRRKIGNAQTIVRIDPAAPEGFE